MNKKALFLLVLVLLISILAMAGCKEQQKLNIVNAITRIEAMEEYDDEGHQIWLVKYFVDPTQVDITTFNSAQIKTYVTVRSNTGNDKGTYQKTFTATIPDDASATEENSYLLIKLDGKKYRVDSHLILLEASALVNLTSNETEEEPAGQRIPSIASTIGIGIAMVIGGIILYWLAIVLTGNRIVMAIAFIIPVLLTITSYISWGVTRGIIMTVFFVIYYILLGLLNKRIAENM